MKKYLIYYVNTDFIKEQISQADYTTEQLNRAYGKMEIKVKVFKENKNKEFELIYKNF
jgi:hypothetical protein